MYKHTCTNLYRHTYIGIETHRHTDGQTNRQTDIQILYIEADSQTAGKQANRQTGGKAERIADIHRQTDRQTV